jgi:hypothetical protein
MHVGTLGDVIIEEMEKVVALLMTQAFEGDDAFGVKI